MVWVISHPVLFPQPNGPHTDDGQYTLLLLFVERVQESGFAGVDVAP